jgi:hypothetical protein
MPALTQVSPSFGPPGTAIALTGSGFTAASAACCPATVPTTYVSPTQLTAQIPMDIEGAAGTSMAIGVFVLNADGTVSNIVTFTVNFPAALLQTYTTVDAVCGEVPGFQRNGAIQDDEILVWIRSGAQVVNGILLRRGFSLDPATWAQPSGDASPSPASVLEQIVRFGAAARLAAAVASMWGSGNWAITNSLSGNYAAEKKALEGGDYDHLFRATGAATQDTGPGLVAGDMTDSSGRDERVFCKEMKF